MFKNLVPMDEFFESIYAEKVLESIRAAGFEDIDSSLEMIAVREAMRIRNFCNLNEVPKRLYYLLFEMILGSFLENAYNVGTLPESFDFEQISGSVRLGDTAVELSGSDSINSPSSEKLLSWISVLKDTWKGEAIPCRRLEW